MARTTELGLTAEWREIGWMEYAYVDAFGKILGGCQKEFRTWRAWYDSKHLGQYIDQPSAKGAVERAHQTLPVLV